MDALLLLVPAARARAYTRAGDFFLDRRAGFRGGAARRLRRRFVFSGAQILAPRALDGRAAGGPFSLNLIWDRLIGAGRLAAVSYPGDWVDVGTPEGLAEAERALAAASR